MSYRLFLVLVLLSFTGGGSVQAEKLVAFAGGEVILPCSVTNTGQPPDFEWSKEGLVPHDVIFLYRHGCETFEMKHPDFEFRTSPFMREVKNGNISLRIFNLKLSDAGKYKCLSPPGKGPQTKTMLDLEVVTASEPKLSVVPAADGTATLRCEARCCLPDAQMEILDELGNHTTAEETREEGDASGCYNVTQTVTLKSPRSRVICAVHQHKFNQSRSAEIFIAADHMKPNLTHIGAAVGGTILVCFYAFATFWSLRDCKRCRCGQGSSPVMSESRIPLVLAENMGNCEIQRLRDKLHGLQKMVCMKDEKIKELEDCMRSQHHVCQHNQPTMVQSPSSSPPDTIESPSPSVDLNTQTSTSAESHKSQPADSQGQKSHPAVRRIRQHRTNSSSSSDGTASP